MITSRHSDFFVARELEEKQNAERKLGEQTPPSDPEEDTPPLPAAAKGKKTAGKGVMVCERGLSVEEVRKRHVLVLFFLLEVKQKKGQDVEPPEPVLPGSLAIGSVSLALARTGSRLRGIPLYKYIGALKNPAVRARAHTHTHIYTHTGLNVNVSYLRCHEQFVQKNEPSG